MNTFFRIQKKSYTYNETGKSKVDKRLKRIEIQNRIDIEYYKYAKYIIMKVHRCRKLSIHQKHMFHFKTLTDQYIIHGKKKIMLPLIT